MVSDDACVCVAQCGWVLCGEVWVCGEVLVFGLVWKCEVGGSVGGLTLQLDHIDGNSDNNNLENLRLLCPNCHTQTDTWVSRNTKNTKRNGYLGRYKRGG